MTYKKANQVLPLELISLIQKYVDGEYIYIPRKNGCKKTWGETSGYRKQIIVRDKNIYIMYKNGLKVSELSKLYFLSDKTIYRIIANMKKDELKNRK